MPKVTQQSDLVFFLSLEKSNVTNQTMYPLISVWTVLPERRDEAIEALKNLAVKVQSREPNTLMYTVHVPDMTQSNLPTPSTDEIIFYEVYRDEAAFKAHVNGDTFVGFVKEYGDCFLQSNGKPYVTLKVMNRIAGFVREQG